MTNELNSPYIDALLAIVANYQPERAFPFGRAPIPTPMERTAISAFRPDTFTKENAESLDAALDDFRDFALLTFACRTALFGVRTCDALTFRAAIPALICTTYEHTSDYRDLFTVFAILKDCAKRLQLTFADEVNRYWFATSGQRRLEFERAFEHPVQLELATVGARAVGDDANLKYAISGRVFEV